MSALKRQTPGKPVRGYHAENKRVSSQDGVGRIVNFYTTNDSLYQELELRYGGGFAQWVVDGLNKASKD